jgi:hypothetical protein
MTKIVLIILVLALGCRNTAEVNPATKKSDPILLPKNTCSSALKSDKQVTQQIGRVGYRDDLNMYYINVYLGGIDSSLSGLVCNMPDELKQIDKKVIFDGEYFTDSQLPYPRLGGETMRYLVLKSVQEN